MKFPSLAGVGEVRGNQHDARKCYALAIKLNGSPEIIHMVETT